MMRLVFVVLTALIASIHALSTPEFSSDLRRKIVETRCSEIDAIDRLGGYTNTNYLLTFASGEKRVLKLFNPLVDVQSRKSEFVNQAKVCKIGLAPQVERITDTAWLIEYVADATPLIVNAENVGEAAKLIASLHSSGIEFCNNFDFEYLVSFYYKIGKNRNVISDDDQSFYLETMNRYKEVQSTLGVPEIVPCHNDLYPENILVSSGKYKLIDWEDAAMNDPAWDVSCFLTLSFVPEELWPAFFKSYSNQSEQFIKRVKIYRPFVLAKTAFFLKAFVSESDLAKEETQALIELCIRSSKQIFKKQQKEVK